MKKREKSNLCRRGFAGFVALVMCLSMLQVTAFAEDFSNETAVETSSGTTSETSGDSAPSVTISADLSKADSQPETKSETETGTEESSNVTLSVESVEVSENSAQDSPAGDSTLSEETKTPEETKAPEEDGAADGSNVTDGTEVNDETQETENPEDAETGAGNGTQTETPEKPAEKVEANIDEIIDQLSPVPDGYEETEAGSGVYEKVDEDIKVDTKGDGSEEVDFDKADNADRTTTKTETKNQQTHKPIKDEAGNITGYEVINSTVTTTTTVREEKKTENFSEADVQLPELKDEDENGNSVVKDGEKVISTEKNPEKGEITVTTWEPVTGEDGTVTWKKTTITQTTTVEADKKDKPPIKFSVYQDKDGNIYFTVPVTENSQLHTGSIQPNLPNLTGKPGYNGTQQVVWIPRPETGEVGDDFIFTLAGSVLMSGIGIQIAGKGDKDINWEWNPDKGIGDAGDLKGVQLSVLVDANGNLHYVYCADVNTPAVPGTDYDLENLEDADYFQDKDAAAKLQAVATNGYWGVEGGADDMGSLQGLLEKLQAAKREGIIDIPLSETALKNWLTPGAAMAGTQAAIWAITNGKDGINLEDPFNSNWSAWDIGEDGQLLFASANGDGKFVWREKAAMAVYNYLLWEAQQAVEHPEKQKPSTDLIGESDVKDVTVTVKELDSPADAEGQTPSKYKTDISFILDVERDRIHAKDEDPLTVKILNPADPEGEPLGVYRLLEDADGRQEGVEYAKYDPVTNTYTLENIVLPNGVNVTLKLSGTQVVEKNAYLVTAEGGAGTSQSFVAVEEGEKAVDLSFNLHFSVKDPEPPTDPDPEEPKDPDTEDPKDPDPEEPKDPDPTPDPDPRPDPRPDPQPEPDRTPDPTPEVDVPNPEVPLAEMPEVPVVDIPEEDVPLADTPEEIEIDDPEVPMGDVPRTGDTPVFGISAALFCLCGLLIAKLRKIENVTK